MSILTTAPSNDCAEISLFGPGVGECMVLHIGSGEWFVIDSCLCPKTKEPVALNYLKSIGVDVSTKVLGLLITHWHQDHIDGAFELFKTCENARLYIPSALRSEEAFQLVELFGIPKNASLRKNIREFCNIIKYIKENEAFHRLELVGSCYQFFNRVSPLASKAIALSPSSAAQIQAKESLIEQIPSAGLKKLRNVIPQGPNNNAVAVHFSFANFSALLGSDLEETGNEFTGWSGIVGSDMYSTHSLQPSRIFKVPHHGSITAHHEEQWSGLLCDRPVSVTTPFSKSALPGESDIQRIKDRSSRFLVSAEHNARPARIKRDRMVDREFLAMAKKRVVRKSAMGHIQIRVSSNSKVSIEINEVAVEY